MAAIKNTTRGQERLKASADTPSAFFTFSVVMPCPPDRAWQIPPFQFRNVERRAARDPYPEHTDIWFVVSWFDML